jgi:hypothetical protein
LCLRARFLGLGLLRVVDPTRLGRLVWRGFI